MYTGSDTVRGWIEGMSGSFDCDGEEERTGRGRGSRKADRAAMFISWALFWHMEIPMSDLLLPF